MKVVPQVYIYSFVFTIVRFAADPEALLGVIGVRLAHTMHSHIHTPVYN